MTHTHPAASMDFEKLLNSAESRGVCVVSDLHLSPRMPNTLQCFIDFCNSTAHEYSALLIIGDLFEYWLGDDTAHDNPTALRVATALKQLDQAGTRIDFFHGNRDFLLGTAFARSAHMTLLPDPCVMQILERTVVFSHGDLLCTNDTGYQRYRRIAHNRLLQKIFLAAPTSWRNALAQRLRGQSKKTATHTAKDSARLMAQDVPNTSAEQWLTQHQAEFIIHGHTHRPASHTHANGQRWVLPDWECEDRANLRWGYVSWKPHESPQLILTPEPHSHPRND